MKITTIGRQMEVQEDLKLLFERKLKKFDKFFDDEATAYVTLSKIKSSERLELTISHHGTMFRAEVTAETFNNALDEAIEKIIRQIHKNKTKLEKQLRSGAFAADAEKTADSSAAYEEETDFNIKIVKTFDMRPMTPSEAILHMNLLGHHFYMFSNAENGKMSVAYKRDDGDYGIIEPM
ncbi:MAG: ribosome-associated translation inhibitor RaiA [Oscillospiraceae bacterium]|nr:MAG: ribosome-associated translation inhibitor RaiA [Oscillospiraceae bacterium]